jgi:Tfp pilus assembly protein PilW
MSRIEADNGVGGFTLLELLVSMVATAIMMAGLIQFFLIQGRSHAREEQRLAMDENLRVAAAMIVDSLRNARYAAPSNVSTWVTWVSGMNANPKLTLSGSSSTPDTISVAGCFKEPVATLSSQYVVGVTGTTLSVTPTGTLSNDLDTGSKSLIRIGEGTTAEFARVTGASGSTINISADLANAHWGSTSSGGANICRVDVVTYSVATDTTTGVPRLMRNENQGAGAQPAAEGISNMKITFTSPRTYTITLSGRSELRDPISGSWLTRNLQATVSLRNS